MNGRLSKILGYGKEPFFRVGRVFHNLFWNADTSTIRLILAFSSLLMTVTLIIDQEAFERPMYLVMKQYLPATGWAVLFSLHFIGAMWRFFDPVSRIYSALAINIYGLGIWLTSTLFVNVALQGLSPGTSIELINCCFGAWAVYRTGLRKEIVTP